MAGQQPCASSVHWTGARLDLDAGRLSLDRLSLHNCTSGETWSAWAEGENLVQGYLKDIALAGEQQIRLPISHPAVGDSEQWHTKYYRLIGPLASFLLCLLSLVYLYRRRNIKHIGHHDAALAEHPKVPLSAKIAVPIILYFTVGLFAYSNAVIGAAVTAEVVLFDRTIMTMSLFDFSLINTVTDMWKAGVYPLSALVCIWSGLWPYLKCLLMLVAWFAPPTILQEGHRRRLLLAMDMLGKWALLDLFLMNMMSVAFRFHITAAAIKFIPKNFIAVDVKVTPQFGLFTFVTAVAFSLVANHVLLAFHRNVVSVEEVDDGSHGKKGINLASLSALRARLLDDSEADEEIKPPRYCINFPEDSWFDAGTKEAYEARNRPAIRLASTPVSLASHKFSDNIIPSIFLNKETREMTLPFKVFLFLNWLLVFCLIIACGVEDTFQFVFSGLAGKLIKVVDPEQLTRRASLLSIARELGKSKDDGPVFEVFYLQSLYLLFSFIFPLVMHLMAFVLLFVRFTLRQAKILFYALEVVSAWAALDVFIVAIIASVLQINQFSHFLQGPMCDPIEKYLGVKECFGVDTELLKGCWLIVAASVTLWCFAQFVQRVAERALADRDYAIHQLLLQ